MCNDYENCEFAAYYIKSEKSPWYIKFCNGDYKTCRRHIYNHNRYKTEGKSLSTNYSPTGSLL